jgi:hypothetical protein
VLDPRAREAQAADLGYVVTGGEAGGRGGLGKGALAMSVVLPVPDRKWIRLLAAKVI